MDIEPWAAIHGFSTLDLELAKRGPIWEMEWKSNTRG
jgi:hypothetical protein